MKEIAYVGVGSNIEPRLEHIDRATAALEEAGMVLEVSGIYETEPYGYSEQPAFLNAVAALVTNHNPDQLRHRLKEIEKKLGRKHRERWHEREIDLDILFFGDKTITTNDLTIPHADLVNRNFVLIPLTEIAPNIIHPVLKKTVEELSETFRDDKPRIVRPRK